MNWLGLVILVVALLVGRRAAMGWVDNRWRAGALSDREAKIATVALINGPILVAGLYVAMQMAFPGNILLLALICIALVPAIGLSAAMIDHARRYGGDREHPE